MNNNICDDGNEATPDNQCFYAWYANGISNNYGPTTAMQILYNVTKDWEKVPNLIFNYNDENEVIGSFQENTGYMGIKTIDEITSIIGINEDDVTIIGTRSEPLKARLPKGKELKDVGCQDFAGSCAIWLMDNMKDGSYVAISSSFVSPYIQNENNKFNLTNGYWILTSYKGSNSSAYGVNAAGYLGTKIVNNTNEYGIRPVITIPKSLISK